MTDEILELPHNPVNPSVDKSGRKEGRMNIFEGKQSAGKSLSAAIWTYSDYCKGRPIYSNIWLKFPFKPLNFFDLTMRDEEGQLAGCTLFIDELNFYCDSRGSSSKLNKEFTQFILQIKKSDINVYGTSHEVSFLDLRLRKHYDYLIRPKCLPEVGLGYNKRKAEDPPQALRLDISNGPNQRFLSKHPTINPLPYLGLYNTKNRINPFAQLESKTEAARFESKKKETALKVEKIRLPSIPRKFDIPMV